jgi:hypothetical protein
MTRHRTDPRHTQCQHTWRIKDVGMHPTPSDPKRPYIFRSFCLVHQRWAEVTVMFAYFWFGDPKYRQMDAKTGPIEQPPRPPSDLERRVAKIEQLASSAYI